MRRLDEHQLSLLRRLAQGLKVSDYSREEYLRLARQGYVDAQPIGNRIHFSLTEEGRDVLADHDELGGIGRRGSRESVDLYDIAEDIRDQHPRRYRNVTYEDRIDGTLWFDTYPANLLVIPYPRQPGVPPDHYDVAFVWGESDLEMGSYRSPRRAVRSAMELALWSEADIRNAFEGY